MEIAGKLAVVSGASSGIGAATTRLLAGCGARVVLLARTLPALEDVAAQIRAAGGTAHVFPVDLADIAATQATAKQILSEVGAPDILVNNAGAGRWLSVEETTPYEAVQMMALPYFAAFTLCHGFVPAMVARGSGWIVNLTSPAALTPIPGATAYSAARGAMASLSTTLRAELRGTGVGVSLLIAGKVASPYFANNPGSEARIPKADRLNRILSEEEVAQAIALAVTGERRRLVLPPTMRVLAWMHSVMPGLVQAVVNATSWRR